MVAVSVTMPRHSSSPASMGGPDGALPGIRDRQTQGLALDGVPVLEVEPDAADGSGAGGHRRVHELADAGQIVHADLDGVAREVGTQRLPAVDVVVLWLQLV